MKILQRLITVLAVTLTCAVIAVSADLFRRFGLSLYTEQYLAGLLAIAMPLLYLAVPVTRPRKREILPPWYDLIAAVAFRSSVPPMWQSGFRLLSELVSARPWDGLIVAAALVLLVLEGLRRTVGSALPYTTIAFFLLALCLAAICPVNSRPSPSLSVV